MDNIVEYENSPGWHPVGTIVSTQVELVDEDSPGLPEGVWRDQFIELLVEAYRNDLRPADERVLRFYARNTRPSDWSEHGRGPVCFISQLDTAERLNLDRKSVYNAERKLESIGMIQKSTLANGHRRGKHSRYSKVEPMGIRFAPAIAAFNIIDAKVKCLRAARVELRAWRFRTSELRTKVRSAFRDITDKNENITALAETYERLPKQIARINAVQTLKEIANALQDIYTHLLSANSNNLEASSSHTQRTIFPHKAEPHSPHQLQGTNKESSVTCNQGRVFELDPLPDTREKNGLEPAQREWTLAQLLTAAGEDLHSFLQVLEPDPSYIRSDTLVDAAEMLSQSIGIRTETWRQACFEIGRNEAALAVLIIDQNRKHPKRPIKHPEGVLRGMLRKAKTKTLNLDRSIFGILQRMNSPKEFFH